MPRAASRRWPSSAPPAPSAPSCSTCCPPGTTSGARSGWSPRPARPASGCASAARRSRSPALAPEVFDGVDLAMFDVPDEVSAHGHRWPRPAARSSSTSPARSAWTPRFPWWCPRSTRQAAIRPKGIIASPELHHAVADRGRGRAAPRVRPARAGGRSYQAASGAGQAGIDTLYAQIDKVAGNRALGQRAGDLRGRSATSGRSRPRWRSTWCPGRARSRTTGWSSEELKIRNESRKILGMPGLQGVGDLRPGAGRHHALGGRARASSPAR